MKCDVPPPGWICTREAGHEPPCAAWPAVHVDDVVRDKIAIGDVWCHVVSDGHYRVLSIGRLQLKNSESDNAVLIWYQSLHDGQCYGRPFSEWTETVAYTRDEENRVIAEGPRYVKVQP